MTSKNPFHQPMKHYQAFTVVPQFVVAAVECAFEDITLSISSFEIDEPNAIWRVGMVWNSALDYTEIESRLQRIADVFNIKKPTLELSKLEDKDWVTEVQKSFKPLDIGNFVVRGSHHEHLAVPIGKTVLKLDAGAAFGTGEHATTSGCLLAIDWVMRKYGHDEITRALDMGCGSGILSMALSKRYHVPTLGIDIDARSIEVANENFMRNNIDNYAVAFCEDGYKSKHVINAGKFDLIVANILARPLVALAPDLSKSLRAGGIAILSGLLIKQERMVLHAHKLHGLKLVKRFHKDGWSALVLQG